MVIPMKSSRDGFTYMTVLILMVIAGIALIGVSRSWRTVMQREMESELLFRGNQIRKGIESYYKIGNNYPPELADLLKDPRFLVVRKHLRKSYPDPFAGDGKWVLIRDANERLIGVHSTSNGKPLKTGNFSEENARFQNQKKYSDWKFIYEPSS
ncbi:MAG: type II secretion system protein [Desulfobacteraceae bacterium]|nr:MAG: type II secretion system protein [Desulfobacteraceae bacterium]